MGKAFIKKQLLFFFPMTALSKITCCLLSLAVFRREEKAEVEVEVEIRVIQDHHPDLHPLSTGMHYV